jgi:hypothetical protein
MIVLLAPDAQSTGQPEGAKFLEVLTSAHGSTARAEPGAQRNDLAQLMSPSGKSIRTRSKVTYMVMEGYLNQGFLERVANNRK